MRSVTAEGNSEKKWDPKSKKMASVKMSNSVVNSGGAIETYYTRTAAAMRVWQMKGEADGDSGLKTTTSTKVMTFQSRDQLIHPPR